MALFLTLLEGPSAHEASPLLATGDRRLIEVLIRELATRLEGEPAVRAPTSLTPLRRPVNTD